MLAGAYSQRYKTVEKDQVNQLKTINRDEKTDVIARSRRLTQETNKRRRAQAQKRKNEQQREEKRRQYILSKRREEQQRATENFQRAPIPNSCQGSRRSSPTRTTTGLEEALKLIRGSPSLSRQSSYSSISGHRKKGPKSPNRTYDPLNVPYYNKYSSSHLRSPSPAERAQEHAEMLDKSLRNYTSSRSLFEQQLEQHQQFLLEEQKMSLHKFNQAIQQEMEADSHLEGTEEIPENDPGMTRSESLSSVDSLEASQESFQKEKNNNKTISSNVSSTSYPRPVQPKATSIVGRVPPHSASVNTFIDSLESASKPFEVNYISKDSANNGHIVNSGLIQNNEEHSYQSHTQSGAYGSNILQEFAQQQVQGHQIGNQMNNFFYPSAQPVQLPSYPTHVYTSPHDLHIEKADMTSGFASHTPSLPSNIHSQMVPQSSFVTQAVTDPSRQTTVSTLAFTAVTTPSYTSVSSAPQHSLPPSSAPSITATPTPITMSHKTPGLTGTTTNYLTSATKPVIASEKAKSESSSSTVSKPQDKGSITNGTLGLVHGRLAILADIEAVARDNQPQVDATPQAAQRKALSHRSASDLEPREVKGILKRPETSKMRKSMSTGSIQKTGLNVKDSIEVARGHGRGKQSGKKSVRFADLHYDEDIPEDTDSVDSNTDLATPVKKVNISHKVTCQGTPTLPVRQRPLSAKVTGSNRVASARLARAASAGTTRPNEPQHAQDRPRATAHIIAHSQEGNDYLNGNPDKVKVVTNNFMGKVPTKSSPSQGVIHTSNNAFTDRNGEIQVSNGILQKADSVATSYHKYVTAPASSQLPQDTASQRKIQEVYNENGLRIDRTPTDDEINWLWEKVRTCLNREPTPSEKRASANLAATDPNLSLSRQAAPVSHKYMDGTSLGLTGSTRVGPGIYGGNTVQQRAMTQSARQKQPGNTGSYMRKFGLLQQRKQGEKKSPQQQHQQLLTPTTSKLEPQESDTVIPVPRSDITESMATFLAVEHFAGRSMSESQVQLAMEEAHQRKVDVRHDARYRAGPSALSLEEQKLMESLDRLNDKLKISETNQQPPRQPYVHTGAFRGRQPISQPQRRLFGNSGVRTPSARQYR